MARPTRVALLTLEALASAAPVRQFVADHPDRIALIALSDPFRPQRGGTIGQTWHLLRHSGPRFIPYLLANFVVPRLAGLVPRRTPPADALAEATPLAQLGARLGIPVLPDAEMNAAGFRDALATSGADAILTFHCDQILSAATIAAVKLGGLNVHCGLLPDHRGPVPTIHALLEDKPRFGITIHRLVPRIDAGAILAQRRIDLPPGTSALAAARLLHQAARPLLADVLDQMDRGAAIEQPTTVLPYCGFPTAAQLRHLARLGRSAAGGRDLRDAWRLPV